MENINQMRKRHDTEKQALRDKCPHEKLSRWMDWAPTHFSGRVKICNACGKVIKRDGKPGPMLQHSIDNPPRALSEEELGKLKSTYPNLADAVGTTLDGEPLIKSRR